MLFLDYCFHDNKSQLLASIDKAIQISGDACPGLHIIVDLEGGIMPKSFSNSLESWICN
jgi:hypothetical protein